MAFNLRPARRFAALALLFGLSGAQAAAAEGSLTLEEALRRALAANPQTQTARSRVVSATALVKQLRASVLPQLSLEGKYTRNREEVAFDLDGFAVTVVPENDWNYKLILRQPVYAGGREIKALKQSRLNLGSTEEAARGSEDLVILSTAANFLAAVQAEALVEVEGKNLELAARRKEQADAFFEAGEVTRVDVLRAEADSKGVERALAAAEQARDTALSRLRLDLGDSGSEESFRLARPEIGFPPLPTPDELVLLAQEKRADVRQAELSREIFDLEVRKQRAFRLPTVRAEASVTQQRADFPADSFGALSLNLSLPLWDSGEISAKVVAAGEDLKRAEIALAERKRAAREDVLQALLDLTTARKSLALAHDQLAAAQAQYDQSFELYRAQEATALDLQAAESTLAAARRAVVTEGLARDLAELAVWASTGTLKDTLLPEETQR